MHVTVCRPGELGAAEVARWTELQAADPDVRHPFLSAAFARAADRARPDVRVAVVEDGGRLIGFWPHAVPARGTARAVAPGHTGVEAVVGPAATALAPGELLRRCGLRAWRFDSLVGPQAPSVGRPVALDRSWVVDLAGGLDAYRAWLKVTHHRRFVNVERKRRKLNERQGGRFEVVTDHALVEQLLGWKSAQSLARGWRDPFAERWAGALVHATLDEDAGGFTAHLGVQWVGDAVGALVLDLRILDVECAWISAYDAAMHTVSPGIAAHLGLVEAAAADAVTRLHMGPGTEPHKQWMANDSVELAAGVVHAPGWAAALTGAPHVGAARVARWLAADPDRRRRAEEAVHALRRAARRMRRERRV